MSENTLAKIQSLKKLNQNMTHICTEGWSVIGKFAGTPLDALTTTTSFCSLLFRTAEGAAFSDGGGADGL